MIDFMAFESGMADCGLPVYVKQLPTIIGWTRVCLGFRAGAVQDPCGKEGVAHLFEHMPFNGIPSAPTKQQMRQVDKRLFANTLNAATSFDGTYFYGCTLNANRAGAVETLFEMASPILDEDEIIRERDGVVVQEIRGLIPIRQMVEIEKQCRKDIYHEHPFSRFKYSFGWEDTLATITREDLISFLRDHYHLGNAFIVVVGDTRLDQALLLADKFGRGLPSKQGNIRRQPVSHWPSPSCSGSVVSAKALFKAEHEVIQQSSLTVSRVFPLQVNPWCGKILASMIAELVREELRGQHGGIYDLSSRRHIYMDHSHFGCSVHVDPRLSTATESILLEAFDRCASSSKDLFDRVNELIWTHWVMREPLVTDISDNAIDDLLTYGYIRTESEKLESLRAITYDELRDLIAREFQPDQLYWQITNP